MASQPTTIPSLTYSTTDLPPADRFEAWRQEIAPLFRLELPGRQPRPACDVAVTMLQLDTVLVSRLDLSATTHRGLRPARKIRRDPLDYYLLEAYLGGGCRGEAGEETFTLDAGGVGFFDLGQPFSMESAQSNSIALALPRELVDELVPEAARWHGTVLRGGLSGLLGAHMQALCRQMPGLAADEAGRAAQMTLAMVAACLAPSPDSLRRAQAPLQSALLRRAAQHIAGNLQADLSVRQICAALRVSRSHLYRAFEAHGGIAAYVQECRLAGAHAALRDPADRRRISEIAYDHGFASAAHFSRAFRRRFGFTPGDVRAGAQAAGPLPGKLGVWLRPPDGAGGRGGPPTPQR